MSVHEGGTNILELIVKIVEDVGRLYEAYAHAFPELEEFWFGLAMEEVGYSNLIHYLTLRMRDGTLRIDISGFDKTKIQSILDYVQKELERIRREKLDITVAVSTSLRIERMLIEGKYLETLSAYIEEGEHPAPYPIITASNHVKALERLYVDLQGTSEA